MKTNLIPEPKIFIAGSGELPALNKLHSIGFNRQSLSGLAGLCRKKMKERGLQFSVKRGNCGNIRLAIMDLPVLKDKGPESYRLKIDTGGVSIESSGLQGIFYGLHTFFQLIDDNRALPPLEILDWPDLNMRGVHLMLAGPIPKFEWLLQSMEELAGYKINTILLEYEDKFPYRKHKIIRHPLAFSEKEVKMLVKTAEENCIQIIPLLQSLGHVEYVLKHNHYRTLRERKNDPYQYCPSNPGSFRMFRELAEQMLPFHGNGRYFHVGGDETYFLGECETCRKKSARQGEKPLLYINHMNKICDFVLSAGKKPILWSDMLVDFPQHIGKLNRDAVVMYWNYGPFDSIVPWVHWKGRVYFKDDLDDIPSEVIRTYLPYWNGGRFPEFMNAFPYTGFFRDHGRDVIAAPIADQSHTLLNTAAFATNAAENAALGMVTTGWPLFPAYHLRAGFVAAADKAWNSNSRDLTKRLNWRFFGVTSDESAHLTVALKTRFPRKAGSSQTKARRTLTKYLREPAKNGRLLEKLRLAAEHKRYSDKRNILLGRAAEVSQHLKTGEWNEFVEIINYDREKIPFTFRELKTLTNGLRRLEGTLAALEARTREVMTDTASSAAIEEYLAALYRYDREKLRKLIPPLRLLLAGERITREDMP